MRLESAPKILLVNPWITDLAAYDFWIKPVGLLYLGGLLRSLGYQVFLLDCLDRHHPELLSAQGLPRAAARWDRTGKYQREIIEKPSAYAQIPRHFSRYGFPMPVFNRILSTIPKPEVILLTSVMTYWYPGVCMAAERLRAAFPGTPIVLGGIYATLCPEHAQKTVQPDYLLTGEAENRIIPLIAELTRSECPEFRYDRLDDLPYPAYDLYPNLQSVPVLSSRGCPFQCSCCASHLLSGRFRQRNPIQVVEEIEHWHTRHGVRHFAFFDDALLVNKERHFNLILTELVRKGINATFHTPNGLHVREIDPELARLMFRAGVRNIRLSFESVDSGRQKLMGTKVSNEDLQKALTFLFSAGFTRNDLGVYVMLGLPDQPHDEVIASVQFVAAQGAKVNLASFSPIPGTREWATAVSKGSLGPDIDPLATNNSIYPLRSHHQPYASFQRLEQWVKAVNAAVITGREIPGFRA